jgi:hypothetical protein
MILTFLPVFISLEGLLFSILAPFPLIVLAVKYPWPYVLALIGCEAGILAWVGGALAFLSFSQYGAVPLVMAGAVRRGWSLSQIIASSVLLPIGVGVILLVVYALVTRQHLSAMVATYLDPVLHALQEHLQTVEQMPGNEQAHALPVLETVRQFVLAVLPGVLVINHLLTNTLNYIVARYYCSRSQPPVQLDAEILTHWRASEYMVWVFIASGLALLLPVSVLSTIGLNVLLVALAIYLLQGCAIVVFWAQRLPLPLGLRWLLTLIALVMAGPLCVVLCIAAGLFDLWVDFRRLRRQPLAS